MPSVGRDGKYDCAILNTSGTEIGLTLVKGKNDKPLYREYTEEPLATQYSTTPDYGAFRPEREWQGGQSDYRAGFGLEYFDKDDPKRYFYGVNIDARDRDRVRLAPLAGTATKPSGITTAASITNGDMELDANWTGGVRSNTQKYAGTWSWLVQTVDAPNSSYQDAVTWSTTWQSKTFTFGIWVYASLANAARIGINDKASGGTTTYSSYHTGGNTWQFLSVTATLGAAADRMRLLLYNDLSVAELAYFDNAVISSPIIGAITAQVDFNNAHYIAYGRVLCKLNTGGTGYDVVHCFPNKITDLFVGTVSGTDCLFICLGWGDAYYYLASRSVEDCEDRWDELVDTDVTSSVDTGDYKIGSSSVKLEVAANCGAGDILATEAIPSVNLTSFGTIKLWVKSSVALNAGDIQILLDNTAKCASPLATLNLPAITADTWTEAVLSLDNTGTLSAVISIGAKMVVDKGAFTLRLDDIRAETFAPSSLTNNTLKYMAIVGTTFYGSDTNSTIVSTVAPLNGGTNWATSLQVGEDAHDIVDLKMFNGLVYIKKSNCRVYYRDSSGVIQPLISGSTLTNTARMYVWRDSSLFIPYGKQGLIEFDGTNKTHIEPSISSFTAPYIVGQIHAVTGDDQWLYIVSIQEDIQHVDTLPVQIMAVREEIIDGTLDWRWHTLAYLSLMDCSSADISIIYQKRLWVGSNTYGDGFYYYPITTMYGDLDSDPNLSYQTGGYIITPWLHANFKGDKKAWYKITLTMEGTSSTIYWRAYYQKLGDGTTWTEINSTDKFKTSPTTSAYLPVDGSAVKPQSTMMRFKFEGVTGSTASTPKLLNYDVRAIWYPPQRTLIEMAVRIKDKCITKGYPSGDETQDAATIKAALDGLKSPTSPWPVAFYPPYYRSASDTKYVRLLTPSEYNVTAIPEDAERLEGVYNLLFETVDGLSF